MALVQHIAQVRPTPSSEHTSPYSGAAYNGAPVGRPPRTYRPLSAALSSPLSGKPASSNSEGEAENSLLAYLDDNGIPSPLNDQFFSASSSTGKSVSSQPSVTLVGQRALPQRKSIEKDTFEPKLQVVQNPIRPRTADSKASQRALTLPHISTTNLHSHSSNSHSKSMVNIRDSVLAQHSSTSSIYPPSTASSSSLATPISPPERRDPPTIVSYGREMDEEYDTDDVSYRLRLLVNNNYFLPPAHHKPSASDFAPKAKPLPSPSLIPAFRDFFRVGRLRSKTITSTDTPGPVLRTASDSPINSRTPAALTRPGFGVNVANAPPRPGRVMVVREKMEDVVTAAKQAERAMQNRNTRREHLPVEPPPPAITFDDVDPTDVVDLPSPSANGYPFDVQASALHGLGVQQSVGAADLADKLPPPLSPMSSISPEEQSWRKALLEEAVSHSLHNSPDGSISSPSPGPSSPTPWRPNKVTPYGTTLDQRIMSPPPLSQEEVDLMNLPRTRPRNIRNSRIPAVETGNLRPPSIPVRAHSPSAPSTPLGPAPRKPFLNAMFSASQRNLSSDSPKDQDEISSIKSSIRRIRRTMSSPRLSSGYESGSSNPPVATLPIIPAHLSSRSITRSKLGPTHAQETKPRDSDCTSYTDMMSENHARISTSFSIPTFGRNSMDTGRHSPTVSAFRDNLMGKRGSSSAMPRKSYDDASSVRRIVTTPRSSAFSPPPRPSTSLADNPLSPPPRTQYQEFAMPRESFSSQVRVSISSQAESDATHTRHSAQTDVVAAGRSSSTLRAPQTNVRTSVARAPPPASPTSFFDQVESHHNAIDDLDSDGSSDEEDTSRRKASAPSLSSHSSHSTHQIHVLPMTPPPSKSQFMRLGNHSSPHLRQPRPSMQSSIFYPPVEHKLPDSPKSPLFPIPLRKARKSLQSYLIPAVLADIRKNPLPQPRHSFDDRASKRKQDAEARGIIRDKNRESLKQFDGMLLKHMEAERDRIKRIASGTRTQQV